MPPVIHSFAARSMYATRLFNLTITNVPEPQTPLYYFGSQVREIWPLVPIAAEHAIGLRSSATTARSSSASTRTGTRPRPGDARGRDRGFRSRSFMTSPPRGQAEMFRSDPRQGAARGVVTAAELLSLAAFAEGRHAQAFPDPAGAHRRPRDLLLAESTTRRSGFASRSRSPTRFGDQDPPPAPGRLQQARHRRLRAAQQLPRLRGARARDATTIGRRAAR